MQDQANNFEKNSKTVVSKVNMGVNVLILLLSVNANTSSNLVHVFNEWIYQ